MEKTSILNKVGKTVLYAVLAVASFLWVYPFLWMISASFKTQNEFFASGLNLIPQSFNLDNFIRAWNNANFGIYFKNSIIVTVSVVVIVLLSTSLAGYVMGRYSFVGKGLIMKIFMASITIPLVFTVIPIKKHRPVTESGGSDSGGVGRRPCHLPDAVFQLLCFDSGRDGRGGHH